MAALQRIASMDCLGDVGRNAHNPLTKNPIHNANPPLHYYYHHYGNTIRDHCPVVLDEMKCLDKEKMRWWLSVLDLVGKWYAEHPACGEGGAEHQFGALPLPPARVLSGPHCALARLISLAHNAVAVTRSKEFNSSSTPREDMEQMLLTVWVAVRQTCDLLRQTSTSQTSACFSPKRQLQQEDKPKNLMFLVFHLVAQDWICHALFSIALKYEQINTPDDRPLSRTGSCLRQSVNLKSTITLFSHVMSFQRITVRDLQASEALWLAHVEDMYRQLCRVNPIRARLFYQRNVCDLPLPHDELHSKVTDGTADKSFGTCGLPVHSIRLLQTKSVGT
uniref:E3 ubiquitin-protein ligase n=1 Tax=Mesocestoides corti TaxID=53468 RepID=A0A5K3F1R3_MESCO